MGYIRNKYAKYRPGLKTLKKRLIVAFLGLFAFSILSVLILKWLPVYYTPLVLWRSVEYGMGGKWVPVHKSWVPLEKISPHLQKAVIASEDPKFLHHFGFDIEAIGRAIDANRKRKVKMGASTISQQTAKNVFLYPSRTYLRKGLEVYFTTLIELVWDKRRILEVYLNVVELGPGIYGAEAASQYYWKKSAAQLNPSEAQLFAAILPNPRRWNPRHPTNFVLRRQNFIRRNIGLLGQAYFKAL